MIKYFIITEDTESISEILKAIGFHLKGEFYPLYQNELFLKKLKLAYKKNFQFYKENSETLKSILILYGEISSKNNFPLELILNKNWNY